MTLQNYLYSFSTISCVYSNVTNEFIISDVFRTFKQFTSMEFINNVIPAMDYNPLVWSLLGSVVVGLSGIFPLLVIPIEEGENLNKGASGRTLKVLLSFAVGGLLGDVFLHLLPEAWSQQLQSSESSSMFCGLWVLAGLLVFIIAEKAFSFPSEENTEVDVKVLIKEEELILNNNTVEFPSSKSADLKYLNGGSSYSVKASTVDNLYKEKSFSVTEKKVSNKQMSGYLNLMANCIDNFTHGLAVGGSFLLSARVGVLSTFAILIHEVPHEVGDFAILLRAGFSRWEAAKAQLVTASCGVIGALVAVWCSGVSDTMEARTSWILPFTAGGFLHIALVTVLPELLQEENPKESLKQMLSLASGIIIMAVLTSIIE
ncbi:zinc transporter Zip99C [Lycorma delicatula]|uniref:zinc transporter Zip99C n=1 Tax=Lycorma delicatula TaxID=130591 RepID=UPI003F50D90D